MSTVRCIRCRYISSGASTTTLTATGEVLTPLLDTPSAETLTIGSTATLVNVAVPMTAAATTLASAVVTGATTLNTVNVSGAATLDGGASTTALTATGEVLYTVTRYSISRNINHWFDSNIG